MCGRYTNTTSARALADHFGMMDVPDTGTHRYNVAPTDEVLMAVERDGDLLPRVARWGLIPHWSQDAKGAARMINARAETLAQRPAYRTLAATPRQRCLVLADGYYEWLRAEDPKQPRLPMWFSLPEAVPFAFAGLWTTWRSPEGERVRSCTIITTAANAVARPVHDRMPVVLAEPSDWSAWLRGPLGDEDRATLVTPAGNDRLVVRPANPLVNSVANDGPDCLT